MDTRFVKGLGKKVLAKFPPKRSLQLQGLYLTGRWLDIDSPTTFNEYVNHLKLETRNPIWIECVDKLRVKELISERIPNGRNYVIPTLWHGDFVDRDILQNIPRPFVVKANHSCGTLAYFFEGDEIRDSTIREINSWMDQSYAPHTFEWPYERVDRKLFAEEFIGAERVPPNDYKLSVFSGRCEIIEVHSDRYRNHRRAFFDRDWNLLDFVLNYPNPEQPFPRPAMLEQLIHIAETMTTELRLGKFARIDLYELDDQIKLGEITFFPAAGFAKFTPPTADEWLGEIWRRNLVARR